MPRRIIVTPLEHLGEVVATVRAPHVCGLLGPEISHPPLPVPESRRLRLSFHDIAAPAPGFLPPDEAHVSALVGFVKEWQESGGECLVLHCWAGISRSWAAAFISRCLLEPERPEEDIAQELRRLAPFATPNPLLVRLADGLLGRKGRMSAAIARIGRGANAFLGEVVHWPLP
jgi:predicted protein tyrosine phosphatase